MFASERCRIQRRGAWFLTVRSGNRIEAYENLLRRVAVLAPRQVDPLFAQCLERANQHPAGIARIDDVVDEVEPVVLGQRENVDVALAVLVATRLEQSRGFSRRLRLLQFLGP